MDNTPVTETSLLACLESSLEDSLRVHHDTIVWLKQNSILAETIIAILSCLQSKHGKIMLAGNGGSAADAQHMAAEYVGRFMLERQSLPAIALTTDSSILTSIANDYSFDDVFSRQILAYGHPGDILMLYSTSGCSKNIIKAAHAARSLDIMVIGITGLSGGLLKKYSDILINVPSESTPRVQEMHLILGHLICEEVERRMSATQKI